MLSSLGIGSIEAREALRADDCGQVARLFGFEIRNSSSKFEFELELELTRNVGAIWP